MKEISVKSADRAAKRHGIIKAKVTFVSTVAQWLGCLGEECILDELVTKSREILKRDVQAEPVEGESTTGIASEEVE